MLRDPLFWLFLFVMQFVLTGMFSSHMSPPRHSRPYYIPGGHGTIIKKQTLDPSTYKNAMEYIKDRNKTLKTAFFTALPISLVTSYVIFS